MAKRTKREPPLSHAKRWVKKMPKLSPLMKEGFRSLWTDEQCDAWAKKVKPVDVLAQAQEWIGVLALALEKDGGDVPYSKQRLAWLAELTVTLEDALAGTPKAEVKAAREARDAALADAKLLRARVHSRMLLLVGGDEERAASLSIASKGKATASEVATSLRGLEDLLARWRKEARLRVLADELGLDEGQLGQLSETARLLSDAEVHAESLSPTKSGPAQRVEGRVLRELAAIHRALVAAKEEGLAVPTLKVKPGLRSVLLLTPVVEKENARIAFLP